MSDFSTSDLETFLQLEDLKGSFAPELERLQQANAPDPDEGEDVIEQESDELEDFSIDRFATKEGKLAFDGEEGFEDPEDSEDAEEVEETTEEAEEEEEQEPEEEGALSGDEDDVEYEDDEVYDVDYGTIITLPDGRELSIETLANGYMAGTDLSEKQEQLTNHIAEFEERVSGLRNVLDLAQLEADKVISDYDGFDWEDLAAKDPQAYVENNRFLERYKARKADLVAAQERIRAEADAKAQEEYQAKCTECVGILRKEIPNWSDDLYRNLLQYAVDLGADKDEILEENRPSVFLALHKAYQFDKGKQQVSAKIKRPGAPKKVVKPGTKPTPASQEPNNAKVAKAFSEGRISHADAFKFLND